MKGHFFTKVALSILDFEDNQSADNIEWGREHVFYYNFSP